MPQRPVSEYDVEKDMKLFARLLDETMCESFEDMSDAAPSERSQLPMMDCMTSIGK